MCPSGRALPAAAAAEKAAAPPSVAVEEGQLTTITQEVARRVDEATEFAKSGAGPTEEVLMTDVWADGGSQWRN